MSTPTAIVVGAGTGLGQAVALKLHRAGLTVVAVDRSEAGLKQLPDEIHRRVADATDPAITWTSGRSNRRRGSVPRTSWSIPSAPSS